jgi:hypothetical protein
MLLDVDGLLTGEKARGAAASAVSGTAAAALNVLGVTALGLSAPASAALFLHATGSLLSYSLDIMFAKRDFRLPAAGQAGAPAPLPYGALAARAAWLLRSFRRRFFFRFFVTVVIEGVTALALLWAAIRVLDRHRVLQRWKKLRDAGAAVAASVAVFLLFGNILRFDWAYREVEQPLLTMVVLMWMALAVLAFALSVAAGGDGDAAAATAAAAPTARPLLLL